MSSNGAHENVESCSEYFPNMSLSDLLLYRHQLESRWQVPPVKSTLDQVNTALKGYTQEEIVCEIESLRQEGYFIQFLGGNNDHIFHTIKQGYAVIREIEAQNESSITELEQTES